MVASGQEDYSAAAAAWRYKGLMKKIFWTQLRKKLLLAAPTHPKRKRRLEKAIRNGRTRSKINKLLDQYLR